MGVNVKESREAIEYRKAWEHFTKIQKDVANYSFGIIINYRPDQPRDDKGRFINIPEFASAGEMLENLEIAKSTQPQKSAWRVTLSNEEEFIEYHPNSTCYVTKDGSTMAVAADGDIVSVCKNAGDSMQSKYLISEAVHFGGTKLDSYDGNHRFYLKCGFEPVSWCKWNDDYAPSDWDSSINKKEDIVFYKYTGNKQEVTPDEADKLLNSFKNSVKASEDYDTAYSVRDNNL